MQDQSQDQKILEQQQALAVMKQKFEKESTPDGQTWNEYEIQQLLRSLPVAIYNQGNKVVETLVIMKTAKQKLKTVYNAKLLDANYDPDLKAANERKAWAENQKEYLDAEIELIIAEGNYKAAELHYTAYDNLYTAVKRASSMVANQNMVQTRQTT